MFKLGFAFLFIFTLGAFAQDVFKIPEPTIINDPDFYVKNTQGKSDGKTIGIDGERLEDHRIYMYDTRYFLERMEMGLQTDDNVRKSLYRDIKNIARLKEDQRGSSVDAFKEKYKKDPLKMGQFKYFELMYGIQNAKKVYDAALANLNYKEKLRVKDRIDLENAPNDEGKQIRESMKESISEVHKLRSEVEEKFAAVLQRGAAIQKKEHTKPSFPVLIVKEDKTLFFAYQKMSGSALTGLGEFLSKGFPQLKEHYKKLGAPDNIILCNHTEFKHNYNAVSRLAMYQLFNKHFGIDADVNERDFKYLTEKELSVWDDAHPKPAGGDEFERKLNRTLNEMWMEKFNELIPTDKGSLTDYRKVIGTGINTVIGYSLPALNNVYFKKTRDSDSKDFKSAYGMTVNSELRSELPTVILTPGSGDGDFVIWVTVEGKSGLFGKDGKPIPAVQKLLANGKSVIGVDLLFQGEFLKQGEAFKEARKVENPRESAAYTHGYNHSLFANRVHDILTVISLSKRMGAKKIHLAGINGAGHWVAALLIVNIFMEED